MKIKCVCGYERESGPDESGKWDDHLRGDEDFVPIIGMFEVVSPNTGATCAFDRVERVELLACPKCGTVRMERR